tara:strand:+ start:12176 stop:12880 length:705 start_codon:yes stop_codon:yes gene_type:complete
MARKLSINHRLLLCSELADKCEAFVRLTDGSELTEINIMDGKTQANISDMEWDVVYTLLTSANNHDTIPKITHRDAVPMYVEMFVDCEYHDDICTIGTHDDPTLRTVNFAYIVPTVTTKEKSDMRKIQKLHSDEFSIIHRKAVDFAKAIFAPPKDLTRSNHIKVTKALRVFAKERWSHSSGRKAEAHSDKTDSCPILRWIAQHPLPVKDDQRAQLELAHNVAKAHILALTGACV